MTDSNIVQQSPTDKDTVCNSLCFVDVSSAYKGSMVAYGLRHVYYET